MTALRTSPRPIHVALIGQKFMGRAHSNAWGQANRFFDLPRAAVLHTVAGRDERSLVAFARQFGWERSTTDWRSIAEDPAVDLVDVATPNDAHKDASIAMIEAGKHVACEKPLAGTLADARAMRDAAAKAKKRVKTIVWFNYRRCPAIGNGGVFGTGLGEGISNRGGYLPERDCDSVFAVVAEEAGWFGAAIVLTLYALMIVLIMGSASGVRDRFSRLVVGGIALYFSAHLFINVSVNLGLIPMTGLTLPLFSTGGSSLLVTFIAIGLALGLSSHHEPSLDKDSFRE